MARFQRNSRSTTFLRKICGQPYFVKFKLSLGLKMIMQCWDWTISITHFFQCSKHNCNKTLIQAHRLTITHDFLLSQATCNSRATIPRKWHWFPATDANIMCWSGRQCRILRQKIVVCYWHLGQRTGSGFTRSLNVWDDDDEGELHVLRCQLTY